MKYLVAPAYTPFLYAFDAVGRAVRRNHKPLPPRFKKVLFIRLEHIGDMILATPVFETFKKNHPNCAVHVLCRSAVAGILEGNPHVDKVLTYDPPWFLRQQQKKSLARILNELRRERYDCVFEMHGDPRNNFIAWRTGAYAVGYGNRGGGFFLDQTINYNPKRHMIEQNLELVRPFCRVLSMRPRIYRTAQARHALAPLLRAHGLRAHRYDIIHPRSGRPEKDLPPKTVHDRIKKTKEFPIVITGAAEDQEYNKQFQQPGVIDLTGKTTLPQLVELIAAARTVIAPDTSVVHIAHALGTQCEAWYITTDRAVWGYPQ